LSERYGRDQELPPELIAWSAPLFEPASAEIRILDEAACWMSDIGHQEHPEYRAEQVFTRALRQPGVALDHHARAFLAMTLALRYEAEPETSYLDTARMLLHLSTLRRAEVLGLALRLAYTLCGGTAALLRATSLTRTPGRLVLRLHEGTGVFAGESVTRRLDRLAQALGVEGATEVA
jgi:exopolyphosphatase/guanosine-5'-triphosphate,3'-diphosphate pyrophosphatase